MSKNLETSSGSGENSAILKRVLTENWRRYLGSFAIGALLLALVSGSTAFTAWIVRDIVNDVFVGQDLQTAYLIAAAIFAVFTIRGLALYGSIYVLGRVANNIVARYQRRTYAHLLKLGVEYFKSNRSAYLVGQINQNILGMRNLLNNFVTVFARDLLTLIALVGVMVSLDPVMSIATLLVLPLLAFIMLRLVKRMRKVARQEVDLNSKVSSSIVETAQGIEIVKSFTMEEILSDKLYNLTRNAEGRSNRIVKISAKTKPPTEILAGFAIASVVALGGYRVVELGHDPGGLFAFLTAAMLAYEPIRKLSSFRVSFERSLVNARMLYEILDTPIKQGDLPAAKDLDLKAGTIELKDITFSYYPGEKVLDRISIKAPAGKTTALVGPSGGGKSTIISLIQRFFDTDKGKILIDGQDISKITAASLRSNIGYVSQQPMLFEGSIMDNIRFGRPDADDQHVIKAAKLAQAHQFIVEQPDGYDTQVGELGGNLSGGQRQRLSIARAILRDAPILLLDEATSALDNESEKLVQQALEYLMKSRTTIVVAHRLSTIRNADRIFVIDRGRVVEEGTHAALMRKRTGVYAKLHGIGFETIPANGKVNTRKKVSNG